MLFELDCTSLLRRKGNPAVIYRLQFHGILHESWIARDVHGRRQGPRGRKRENRWGECCECDKTPPLKRVFHSHSLLPLQSTASAPHWLRSLIEGKCNYRQEAEGKGFPLLCVSDTIKRPPGSYRRQMRFITLILTRTIESSRQRGNYGSTTLCVLRFVSKFINFIHEGLFEHGKNGECNSDPEIRTDFVHSHSRRASFRSNSIHSIIYLLKQSLPTPVPFSNRCSPSLSRESSSRHPAS